VYRACPLSRFRKSSLQSPLAALPSPARHAPAAEAVRAQHDTGDAERTIVGQDEMPRLLHQTGETRRNLLPFGRLERNPPRHRRDS
jgi:hypothetical protein